MLMTTGEDNVVVSNIPKQTHNTSYKECGQLNKVSASVPSDKMDKLP